MARIRSIKPEFWTSETVAALPLAARLTFIGLWSYVDDNGVGIYNERLIASSLYPMDDPRESLANVRESVAKLRERGLIACYAADGRRLIHITGWDEHQRVDKARNPRYPRPDECEHDPLDPPPTSENTDPREDVANVREDSAKVREDVANVPVRSREQGAGSREQGTSIAHADAFARFWDIYPRRVSKKDAQRKWQKAIKDGANPDQIVDGAKRYSAERHGKDPKYTKHPNTWLQQGCWLDEPAPLALVAGGHQPFRNPVDQSVYDQELLP